MKKKDFRRCTSGAVMARRKFERAVLGSVTDPTYAQSGRDLVLNPMPYEMKDIYQSGIPLKDMQPFDGMYKDKHDAFQAAKEYSESQKKDIKDKLNGYENEKNNPTPPTE